MVPKRGLEPPLPDGNYTLNVARLPIPPLRHMDCWSRSCNRARTVGRIAPIAVSHLAIQPRACQACRYYSFRNSSRAAKGRLTIERPEATEKSTTAGGLTGTNLWIHPAPDHRANLARFTSDPSAPLPSLFISSPSAKDPDCAAGKRACRRDAGLVCGGTVQAKGFSPAPSVGRGTVEGRAWLVSGRTDSITR
jgi:hypothetical protein